jgi:tripeptidyl-peptidase-1
MMRVKILVCLAAFVALLDAVAIPPHHEIHEKRETLHPRWTKGDRVKSHKLLPMRIGLTQTNLDNGYEHLMEV